MSETLLKSALEEYLTRELTEYDSLPEHTFSKKHKRAMKRVFKQFEKNLFSAKSYGVVSPRSHFRLTPKVALILIAAIFLAAFAGSKFMTFTSGNFRGRVYKECTKIIIANSDNCPSAIEEKYYLPCLPEDFQVSETNSRSSYEYTCYQNKITGKIITFTQDVKREHSPIYLNTEGYDLEEITVNECSGLLIDYTSDDYTGCELLWDNGDYILEICGEIDKNLALYLANTAEIYKN